MDRFARTHELDGGVAGFVEGDDLLLSDLREALGVAPRRERVSMADDAPCCPGFRLTELIGRGGNGCVYSGEQLVPSRPVAVKVLHAGATATAEEVHRLQREAQLLAHLEHPSIPRLYAQGRASNGAHFFAMEHVRGDSLPRWLASPRALSERLRVLAELAEAIAAAHGAGVLHRDIKPSNVIVRPDGRVALLDFGLAIRPAQQDPRLTSTLALHGTPTHMSPERFAGEPADERSDLFALGVVAHEALCGRHPFIDASTSWLSIARAIVEREPHALGADVPHVVARAIETALQRNPARRTIDAARFAAAMRAGAVDAVGARPSWALWSRAKRSRLAAVTVLVALAIALAIVAQSLGTRDSATLAPAASPSAGERLEVDDWRPGRSGPFPLPLGPVVVIADAAEFDLLTAEVGVSRSHDSDAEPLRRALLLEALGRNTEAISLLDVLLAYPPGPGPARDKPSLQCRRVRNLLAGGDAFAARAEFEQIERRASTEELPPRVLGELRVTQAELLLTEADVVQAKSVLLDTIDSAQRARERSLDRRNVPGHWILYRAQLALAAIARAQGEPEAADKWIEKARATGVTALARFRHEPPEPRVP